MREMLFSAAMVASYVLGLVLALALIQRRSAVTGQARFVARIFAGTVVLVTALPNAFLSVVVGGMFGGSYGSIFGIAHVGVMAGIALYVFATTALAGIVCVSVVAWIYGRALGGKNTASR